MRNINAKNFIKIVGAIFEKINFYFFSCELPLILGVGEKLKKKKKKAEDIYKRTLDIEFERDRSIALGSTIGDGQTDRQTVFKETFFRMWK